MSLTQGLSGFPPWLTIPHCQYYPPPLCHLPREIPQWHSLAQEEKYEHRNKWQDRVTSYMQERLTAGNPQRLLEAEIELLLLLRILHDESIRRQEAPSLTTLKHREETDNKSSECLFEYVSVCKCSICVYTLPHSFITERKRVWGQF